MILDLTLCWLVAIAAALLYRNALGNEFVFDDRLIVSASLRYMPGMPAYRSVQWQRELRNFFTIAQSERQLLWWTYRRDAEQSETDETGTPLPAEWHATTIWLHCINAALVYGILRAWFGPVAAMIGALGFGAHPLAQPSVATISGRSSVLCGTFCFGAILAFLAGAWWLTPLLGWAAWKSKEEALGLPAMLAAVWWWG